ncbi:hypothetical protein BpHYR1_042350 [Brachionus plicatilis]|uniref:Uncharacterized protein n=1 Tax=Brachionus plicatilis TaxID=10195 RepID=A0A3M7SUJ2_BRAPC|nr:hypothetical protein BpHYR1_042350 [Brachionus plicatilis]
MKIKKSNRQLHNGVGYSLYLDSKPLLYSSTSLTVNETEWLSPVLTYLSLNSKSRFETVITLSGLNNYVKWEHASLCDIYEIESARREKLMNALHSVLDKPQPKLPKFFNQTKSSSTTNFDAAKKPLQPLNKDLGEVRPKPKLYAETSRVSIQFENKQLDSIESQINSHLRELESNRNNFRIAESYCSESSNYLEDLENFNPSALYRSKKLETLFKSKSSRKRYQPLYKNFSSLNFDYKPNHDFQYSIKPNPARSNNFLFNPSIIDSEFFLDNDGLTEVEKIRNQLKEDYARIPQENRARSVSSRKSANLQKLTNNRNTIDFGSTLQLKEKLRAIAQKHQIKNFYLNPTTVPNSATESNSSSGLKTISFKNSVFKQDEEEKMRVKSSLNFCEFDSEKMSTQYRSESFLNLNSQIITKPKIVGYSEPKTSTTIIKPTDNPLARLNFTFLRSSSINRPFVIDNSTQSSFRNPISINGRSYFLSDEVNKRNIRLLNKTSSKVTVDGKLSKFAQNKEEAKKGFGAILAISKPVILLTYFSVNKALSVRQAVTELSIGGGQGMVRFKIEKSNQPYTEYDSDEDSDNK